MKGKRYSTEQIIGILKEIEAGASIAETARKHGTSEATIYIWRKKFGGMDVSDARRLRELESENARLKKIVAQQILDNDALKDLLTKKW